MTTPTPTSPTERAETESPTPTERAGARESGSPSASEPVVQGPHARQYGGEPGLPDPAPEPAGPVGGLVQLGAPDAVVCEGDTCWIPPAAE